MIIRISQKLSTKIKTGPLSALPLDDNPYADWSAHLFAADRTQYILVCNTRSMYSTVFYGKGITHDGRFIDHALSSIREFMQEDGQQFIYQRFIAPASARIRFARALNRSVTGMMNDLVCQATVWLTEGELSPFDVGFRLNGIPFSPLVGINGDSYATPRDAFKALPAPPGL